LAAVGLEEQEGTIFEALWAPRWFGQDQALAIGQEATFVFRGPVPPPENAFVVLSVGMERPRYEAHCRLLDIRHEQLGKLQAIQLLDDGYEFIRSSGEIVRVARDGTPRDERAKAMPDWTIRVIFEILP
jgi:hypothetical protein